MRLSAKMSRTVLGIFVCLDYFPLVDTRKIWYTTHMKKFILISFVFAFIINFNINANSVRAYDAGCTGSGPYSTTTGQLCNTNSIVECPAGDLFSSVTGQRCTSWNDNSLGDSNQQFVIGSRGESVKAFQQLLLNAGFSPGKIDGIYGSRTNQAAIEYYRKYPPIKPICPPGTEIVGMTGSMPPHYICGPVTSTTQSPTISGVSGPQTLNVGQEGTWTVTAYDKSGGSLSYGVVWGDEVYAYNGTSSVSRMPIVQQSATFTHTYSQAGTYTPAFTVTNSYGKSAKTSLTVKVNGDQSSNYLQISPNSAAIKVGQTANFQALFNNCPSGVQCFAGPLPVQATWTSSNPSVATVLYKNVCPPGLYCIDVLPDYLTAVVTGVSAGTTIITASYQGIFATAAVTVYGDVQNQAPTISSISPSSGIVGSNVTITGTGFTSTGNKIKFGNLGSENNPAYSLNSNGTSITFPVPSSNYFACWYTIPACKVMTYLTQPGKYEVSVINANGTSNTMIFTVVSAIGISNTD